MEKAKRVIMSGADIDRTLNRMVLQILENNSEASNLAIVGIHTGGVYLAKRIQKIIEEREKIKVPSGSLDITLYRDDWSLASQNPVVKMTDIDFPVEQSTIILVDDVLFTGRTIRAALDAIMDFGRPRSIQLAVLIDRRGGRELPIQADYAGMELVQNLKEHVYVLLAENSACDEVVLVNR